MIIYTVISNGATVLVEYSDNTGDHFKRARDILSSKVDPYRRESKIIQEQGDFVFHYSTDEKGLTFMCLAAKNEARIAFSFLKDIQNKFYTQFPSPQSWNAEVPEYYLNETFRELPKVMEYWNSGEADHIQRVKKEIRQTKDILIQNVEKAAEREGKISDMYDTTNALNSRSTAMYVSARSKRRRIQAKNWALMGVVLLFCLFIMIVIGVVIAWQAGAFD
eukprot:TRINITY_DN22411_c0_g1_i1.p1 TRINITY_DN22411_c0_g1~~TRINITY_DN22411_c0_g1_i1.p1  ORF type:complete len:220 (-),score=28.62 TRINITY_DN22411_c0_g1_i1:69-728(-)